MDDYEYFLNTDFSNYAGEWVIIKDCEVITHSRDLNTAIRKASKINKEVNPFIFYVRRN